MPLHVLPQVGAIVEALAALGAEEGGLPRVGADVVPQVAQLTEGCKKLQR